MPKRITVIINDENDKMIRKLQAKMISSTVTNWSYSKVLNITLNHCLKSIEIKKLLKEIKQ